MVKSITAHKTTARGLRTVCSLLLATVAALGCGGADDKVIVTGKVTYDGKTVSNGDIRFYPKAGSKGRPSGAPIVDGTFQAHYKGGVPIGTHRVEIRAFVLEGVGPAAAPAPGAQDLLTRAPQRKNRAKPPIPVYVVEGRRQFLPPRFNQQSELEVTVSGEKSQETHDFNLTSNQS